MEKFYYEFRHTPPMEALINTIITNQQTHYKTINRITAQFDFLARNLAYSGVSLPLGLFDGDDTQLFLLVS